MLKGVGSIFTDILIEAGIDHVFGLPGGAAALIYDALVDKKDKIRAVLARQEGGAACMADIYGRLTGKPGVLMGQGLWIGTSGGYGIVEAYLAGVPMLVIADVSDYGSLTQHGPYQCASGEYGAVDLPGIMRSMTKYTTYATTASEFVHGVQLAIKHATTGRPGPACVLFKWEVSYAQIEPDEATPKLFPLKGHIHTSPACISKGDAKRIAEMLLKAEDPVMITGRGVHSSKAYKEVQELAEIIGMPVATSYMGKSGIPETHDLALGTMGAIGQKVANEKIAGADLLLAVGTCLAPDNTKSLSPDFIKPEKQKIIHIDIESLNTGWTYPIEIGVTSDAKLALREIINSIKDKPVNINVNKRIEELKKIKAEYKFFSEDVLTSDEIPILPERVVKDVNDAVSADDLIVLDAGNNRVWFAHHFQSKSSGQIIAPGGAAGVGYGIAASLAAQIIQPDRKIISVCGDGGMMMHLYCLEMAKQYELPVTYVILNNSCLGNVRDFQAPDRRIATEYASTNFATIAQAVGCKGIRIEKPGDFKPVFKEALGSDVPTVIDVVVSDEPHFKVMP
ncbi:MAG: thiamine pyrophosphate-binding protein [Deltaproteobacteria bacterium]|nr:thiamine pyrophosphate-binding protein [Deltaproteobacteria bacterium]